VTHSKLNTLAKLILDEWRARMSNREGAYLSKSMKRAILSECCMAIMVARYEVEAERPTKTGANVYVDATKELREYLELDD
jgi:hypothetical protein